MPFFFSTCFPFVLLLLGQDLVFGVGFCLGSFFENQRAVFSGHGLPGLLPPPAAHLRPAAAALGREGGGGPRGGAAPGRRGRFGLQGLRVAPRSPLCFGFLACWVSFWSFSMGFVVCSSAVWLSSCFLLVLFCLVLSCFVLGLGFFELGGSFSF